MKPLREILKGHLSDVFNKVYRGQTLSIPQLELLDDITTRLAKSLDDIIEAKTLEKCKKLNTAIKHGFEVVKVDIDSGTKDTKVLQEQVSTVETKVTALHDAVRKLIDEVNKRPISAIGPMAKPHTATPQHGYSPQPVRGTPIPDEDE